jgi:hypothetical protein
MRKIQLSDVKNLYEYEKVREATRARVIELKRRRRVALGDRLSLLFENRETVLFQIQEMVRAERIVDEAKVRDELDAYNPLIPAPAELSATLFIEIPELARMSQEQVREAVNRFQGLERDALWLVLGEARVPALFEPGHSKEEKMAAVQFVRFRVTDEARGALANPQAPALLVVRHPSYEAQQALPPGTRAELLADLAAE